MGVKKIDYPDAIIMMIKEVFNEAYFGKQHKALMYMVQHEVVATLPKKAAKNLKELDRFSDGKLHRSTIFQFLVYTSGNSVMVLMRPYDSPTTHLEEKSDWMLTAFHEDNWYKTGFEAILNEARAKRYDLSHNFEELTGREMIESDIDDRYFTERRKLHVFEPGNEIHDSRHFVILYGKGVRGGKNITFKTKEIYDRSSSKNQQTVEEEDV